MITKTIIYILLLISFIFSTYAENAKRHTVLAKTTSDSLTFPITFGWYMKDTPNNNQPGDILYKLVISTDSLGTLPVFIDSMIADKYNGNNRILPDTTWYLQSDMQGWVYNVWLWWKVNARFTNSLPSGWSEIWKFKVNGGLPVEISSFTATSNFETVNLKWVTISETNCYKFEIQKAKDVPDKYETIGFVPGHGTTIEKHEYTFTDQSSNGKWFYRLIQIDLDGKRNVISPVELTVSGMNLPDGLLQNYPNPFNSMTTIIFSIPQSGHVRLKVYDIIGNIVKVIVDENTNSGKHIKYFSGENLASGVYVYSFEYNNTTTRKKMLLLK